MSPTEDDPKDGGLRPELLPEVPVDEEGGQEELDDGIPDGAGTPLVVDGVKEDGCWAAPVRPASNEGALVVDWRE